MGSTPNAKKQKPKHTENIKCFIPSQLINSLNQTQINQHYIDKVLAENQQVSKPLTIIITPSSNALCGVKQDVCLLCYTTHADIKIGVTNIIKERFDYHKYGGLIVILVSIISGEFYYDQNQLPRHIEKLQQDIIFRLPDNIAVIWDYSKCTILNIEPLSPFIKYRNALCSDHKIFKNYETFNINKETKPQQLQLTNCQHIDDANNLASNSEETKPESPDDITLPNVDDDEEKYFSINEKKTVTKNEIPNEPRDSSMGASY